MSSNDKTRSPAKKTRAASSADVISSAKHISTAGQVNDHCRNIAAIAAANGTNRPALSEKHKKLLNRQAALIKMIEQNGVSGSVPSSEAKELTTKTSSRLQSKSSTQELAKQIGIWTPSGKLASSYKK